MKNTLIISTGGTFNKVYNKVTGNLDIDKNSNAINTIASKWLTKLDFINIIGKDSLEFTNSDRETLLNTIKLHNEKNIIVIHGTDTIDLSSEFIAKNVTDKTIIFTGAMVPFSIDPIEATANLAFALGAINFLKNGVYIAINNKIVLHNKIKKDKTKGEFYIIE